MNNKLLLDNLRCIPDWPKKGINFRDVTTLFKNPECIKTITDEMCEIYKDKGNLFKGEVIRRKSGKTASAK